MSEPIVVGILPVNALSPSFKYRVVNSVRFPMADDMLPFKPTPVNHSVVSCVHENSSSGSGPGYDLNPLHICVQEHDGIL